MSIGAQLQIEPVRYGHWLVIGDAASHQHRKRWLCRCDCGAEKVLIARTVRTGASRSCGCQRGALSSETWADRRYELRNLKRSLNEARRLLLSCQAAMVPAAFPATSKAIEEFLASSGERLNTGRNPK